MLTIREITLPETVDADWHDYQVLSRAHGHELIGGHQWDITDEASLLAAQNEEDDRVRRYLAQLDGVTVGHANSRTNLVDDPEQMNVFVYVLPEHRGKGVGRALAERLKADAEGFGRFNTWPTTTIPADGEETLSPPNGVGVVPANHPGVRLALSYGFKLGQVERVSRYDFASPRVDPAVALAEAAAVAGADYAVITWEGPADDSMLADLGKLREGMYTDTPSGDLTVVEAKFDAERMRAKDAERLIANRMFRAVVRHVPSGSIVGLNELMVERSNPDAFVDQWDTIVLPEHRGHRLGMLVKAANLIQLRDAVPTAEAIMTWNAEENRHMLAVNEALGFYPVLAEAAFELKR